LVVIVEVVVNVAAGLVIGPDEPARMQVQKLETRVVDEE
jgi:hypothetical protein